MTGGAGNDNREPERKRWRDGESERKKEPQKRRNAKKEIQTYFQQYFHFTRGKVDLLFCNDSINTATKEHPQFSRVVIQKLFGL